MGEATRGFAIAKTMEILRAYVRKIEDASGYLDCLSPEGRRIVENYDNNVDGQKTLLLKASESEDFFSGMPDDMVLAYADVCRKMNDRFDLNVKKVYPIERLAADEKGFWETLWGALQGEFNENPSGSEILIDMGLNFIPFVGQACDARDIAACLKKLVIERRANEIAIWVTLLLTAVGCVPYAGDVVKAGCKAILKGADDVVLTVLKKLDAENVYRAFRMFRAKFISSLDKAIEMVCKWIEEARKSKYGSKVDSVLASARENLRKSVEFMRERIDEIGERLFKKERLGKIRKQFTMEPFDKTGKLKSNICYKAGEYDYLYETDELGRICKCTADNLHIKNHDGRLRHNPNTPGKQEADHAGHLIADVFGGSPELDNLVTQSKAVNQKLYRDIERKWQTALEKGEKVTDIKIEILYNGNNVRPAAFKIECYINGTYYTFPSISNL